MKKRLKTLLRKWFVIPKYEKQIKVLNSQIAELEGDKECMLGLVNKYKAKLLKIQREKEKKENGK